MSPTELQALSTKLKVMNVIWREGERSLGKERLTQEQLDRLMKLVEDWE